MSDAALPTEPQALAQLLSASRAELAAAQRQIQSRDVLIEHLKLQIARLKRRMFGRSSEQLQGELAQLVLALEQCQGPVRTDTAAPVAPAAVVSSRTARRPVRRPLPAHLPREVQILAPACQCPQCGGAMDRLGEDVSEMLEYVPARLKVVRHVRPKLRCGACVLIVQQSAPSRPIARALAGPGLLAHIIVSKYADHLPLYRQSAILARQGVELDRSTLADWVGGASRLLMPLVDAIGHNVCGGNKVHADDTPMPVLDPGRGQTKTGRLWTYVRDDRPAGSDVPAAVWLCYSPDRKGVHPKEHLRPLRGALQADGYSGFNGLYDRRHHPLTQVACWAHVRRKSWSSPRCWTD